MDFYLKAAKIIDDLDARKGSIKSLCLTTNTNTAKRTYALVLETLKYRAVLEEVIDKSGLLKAERKIGAQGKLALVLVHDLLLNRKGIVANGGPFKAAVMRHGTRLRAEFMRAKIKAGAVEDAALAKTSCVFLPRWARINTLKADLAAVTAKLADFTRVSALSPSALTRNAYYVDEHVKDLLAFHPDADITRHTLYRDGWLVLQNKASCFPAVILHPPPGATVIDTCAAPGNKTSHVAALLGGTGRVIAFEKDVQRTAVLRAMMHRAGAAVDVVQGDFMRAPMDDPRYANATHLLLDPSCSGSGIVGRLDHLTDRAVVQEDEGADKEQEVEEEDVAGRGEGGGQVEQRLAALADFQLALLLRAMAFPHARRITYSTCSVHAIENENVVMKALQHQHQQNASNTTNAWRVEGRERVLPDWPNRGIAEECGIAGKPASEGFVRAAVGDGQGTIGFFVACLVRDLPAEEACTDISSHNTRLLAADPLTDEQRQAYMQIASSRKGVKKRQKR